MYDKIFPIIFILLFVYVFYMMFFRKGFRGNKFGAKETNTIGEVSGKNGRVMKDRVKVYQLLSKDNAENLVGLELVSSSFLSYQMMSMTLSMEDTKQLVTLLENAVEQNHAP